VDSPYPFESTRYGVTKWWGVFKFQRCPTWLGRVKSVTH
jgi:hypothetical protein